MNFSGIHREILTLFCLNNNQRCGGVVSYRDSAILLHTVSLS